MNKPQKPVQELYRHQTLNVPTDSHDNITLKDLVEYCIKENLSFDKVHIGVTGYDGYLDFFIPTPETDEEYQLRLQDYEKQLKEWKRNQKNKERMREQIKELENKIYSLKQSIKYDSSNPRCSYCGMTYVDSSQPGPDECNSKKGNCIGHPCD